MQNKGTDNSPPSPQQKKQQQSNVVKSYFNPTQQNKKQRLQQQKTPPTLPRQLYTIQQQTKQQQNKKPRLQQQSPQQQNKKPRLQQQSPQQQNKQPQSPQQIPQTQELITNIAYLRSILGVAEGFLTGYKENNVTILLPNNEECKRLLSFFNNEYHHMKQGLSTEEQQTLERLYDKLYAISIAMERVQVLKVQKELTEDANEKKTISEQIKKLQQFLPPVSLQ